MLSTTHSKSIHTLFITFGMIFLCFSIYCIYFISHTSIPTQIALKILSKSSMHKNLSYITRKQTAKYEDDIKPFLNPIYKQIAWQKFFNGTGHVILFHARKAAGTTLEMWIKRMLYLPDFPWNKFLKKRNITHKNHKLWKKYIWLNKLNWTFRFESYEAYTYFHFDKNKNAIDQVMKNNPYAIYVMAFRNPIDRILSQYEFEWKWGCWRCNETNNKLIQQSIGDINDTYNNMAFHTFMEKNKSNHNLNRKQIAEMKKYTFSNIEFEDFIRRVDKFEMNNTLAGTDEYRNMIAFGAYLNNYYLWMFCCNDKYCNIQKHFENENRIEECYRNSVAKIKSFDIVMMSEWLNDLRTRLYLNELIFNKVLKLESYDDRMFVDMVPVPFRHFVKNKGRDYMINKWSYRKLKKWNKWDLKLYKFVETLVFERQKQIWDSFGGKLLYS
eukprot:468895_1